MAGGDLGAQQLPQRRRVVDFVRLLNATETTLQQGVLASTRPDERVYLLELNRQHVFLKALREQLTELHSLDLGVVLAPKTLQGYSFRVDALERILSARKQELRRFKAMEGSRPTGSGISTSTSTNVTSSARGSTLAGAALSGNAPPAPGPIVGSPLPISIRPGLPPPLPFSKVGKGGGAKEAEGIDRDLQEKVDREKEAQQMLTEQLGELVGALKASSMLVHSNLKTQNKVLDNTEDAAQRNLDGLQVELKKTEEQLKKSWSNSLTSFFMIFMMLAIFFVTFLFMRVFPKRRWMLW